MTGGAPRFALAPLDLWITAVYFAGVIAHGLWESRGKESPGDDFLPWPGLGGVVLLGFYYWTLNQFVVQRTLGARTLEQGRKGALFAGFLKLPNLLFIIVPGAFAVLLYPDLTNPDVAFPALAFDLLPVGARGLVLTAVIAAVMSSLDSALNAGIVVAFW